MPSPEHWFLRVSLSLLPHSSVYGSIVDRRSEIDGSPTGETRKQIRGTLDGEPEGTLDAEPGTGALLGHFPNGCRACLMGVPTVLKRGIQNRWARPIWMPDEITDVATTERF
jgi:hypothetical protein